MAEKVQQRICIKFYPKLSDTCAETYAKLKKVYGEDSMSSTRVYELFKRFQHGSENIENEDFKTLTVVKTSKMRVYLCAKVIKSIFVNYPKSAPLAMIRFSPF
ncbi:hypothetical protein AVEN_237392-1 [Araneus ventricosus]|uniref:Mos1 transposase HTH domain-containing protein n=1 Tax=Araneus ventricosus TaxID=182803 RepID=A0A4Y2JX56_ARAVE|nr:hypothetical protein AVEN_237392-1 [Araneus ventricosus]